MRLTHHHRSRGFTLVEVMITVFVTAVGLLTVAGLQAAAKKAGFEATQRSIASALAQDMVERMRAAGTKTSTANLVTNYVTGTTGVDASASVTSCFSDAAASSAVCTPAQMAAYDKSQWAKKLNGSDETLGTSTAGTGGLMNPIGCIENPSTGVFRVVIAWRGMSPIAPLTSTDPQFDACGQNNDDYKDPVSGTADALRRVLFVEFL